MSLDPTGITTLIGNIASAAASVFGFAKQRDTEKNAAPIVAGKERQKEQQATDGINASIAKGDVSQIRKDLAE